ncbi:PREDICTED: centrosomal protein of 131 kDa [Rhagoletis zephyria]|uniref:centrosomal protein of 131 kDa n=1 Tax=Rhagoletis zephyria TaxID=28612 RepID=UPI000811A575|nr:PREDICTED: centrosomal protein of 131 kDa [Rhagoletis zephyria]
MDLCLRGSQINLVERQKPRPKYNSQTNLYNTSANNSHNGSSSRLNNSNIRTRPRSAQFFTKRSRSSPFLNRPQSAEPCQFSAASGIGVGRALGSNSGQYCDRGGEYAADKFSKNKRYQSISSSNLLKLLLDEPIKRSWLFRGSVSSPETQSEQSSARKYAPTPTVGSSVEIEKLRKQQQVSGENNRFSMSASTSRLSSATSASSYSREKSAASTASTTSLRAMDYWHTGTASMLQNQSKPDLPGRVSFSKPNTTTQYEPNLSLSDCENDKQKTCDFSAASNRSQVESSISAPGPATLPAGNSFSTKPEFVAPTVSSAELSTAAGAKKSVHFGATAGGEGILAETYEYPKCPSENCSCSTRSSSTASSTQDVVTDAKCACDSPTCKFSAERMLRRTSVTGAEDKLDFSLKDGAPKQCSPTEELKVIRDYKSVVGDQLENSVVKQILEEDKTKFVGYESSNNTREMSTYLDKYVSPTKTNVYSDKPNNLSEAKQSTNFKSGTKKNLASSTANELNKMDNNLESNLNRNTSYAGTSETVINNYLKVAATTPLMTKKKENNRPDCGDKQPQVNGKKPPTTASTNNNQPPKGKRNGNAKLKKSTSFGSLREDSSLTEFNIDKVDSWMSMYGESMQDRKTLGKHKSLEADFDKLTGELSGGNGLDLGAQEDDEQAQHNGDEPGDSGSQVSTRSDGESTYDEIVSVIKEIDEDKKKDNYAERAANELELKLNTQPDTVTLPSTRSELTNNDTSKSPDKYTDILNYLDNVEDSCDRTLLETRRSIPESNRSEMEFVVEPDIAEDVPKLADLLMLPNHQLARRVIALSLRANELANAVYLSKEHVIKVRTEKQKCIRTEKAHAANRMREQKKHYETIVKRHQGFIEQLLKDKGSLCEKVAALTRRLESQNQAWEHKLEAEVARVKEVTLAGEKIRRERWVRENTKKIKELTVKGLETEINKMTCNHQREVTELKQAHQYQLLNALEEARLKHEQIENSIRESCAQDRESIIEKERLAIRERFERQLEEERKCFDEQRHKLIEEFAAERERLHQELKAKDADYQARRHELQREKEMELEQTVAELQDKMFKQEEKYQNRINTIEKQYEADFKLWKRDYENECKVRQVEKENTIRQHYRTERDRQIDAIVNRMDSEALKNAEEYEAKLNRLKEKYEKDLELVDNAERVLREKFTETRSSLAEADAQVRNSEAEIKQLKMELEHSKKMCNDFLAERDQLRDNLRNEVQSEVSAVKMERDNEIQKIHKRVQQAIEKKDATIDLLQKENGSLRERCLKLETVIRQQRKDYCVK